MVEFLWWQPLSCDGSPHIEAMGSACRIVFHIARPSITDAIACNVFRHIAIQKLLQREALPSRGLS
jgi:hypothetical protein